MFTFAENPSMRRRGARGSALVLAVLLVMVITVIGLGLMFVADLERDIAFSDQRARLARDIANSALILGKFQLGRSLEDDNWSDSLIGKPAQRPVLASVVFDDGSKGTEWLCYDFTSGPGVRTVADESRGCIRPAGDGAVVDAKCAGKIKGVPVFSYTDDTYMVRRPYTLNNGEILGYYNVWVRNVPSDGNQDLSIGGGPNWSRFNEDGKVEVIAEVWVKRFNDPDFQPDATPVNPIVARAVFSEVIDKGELPRFAYPGRNIDQHNTNTIYEFYELGE